MMGWSFNNANVTVEVTKCSEIYRELSVGKELEGGSRGLFQYIIITFAWSC
jgi:hypothetical protein